MFRFREKLINTNLFRSIKSQLSADISKMYTKYDFVLNLNLQF